MKYDSKRQLIAAIETEHELFVTLIESLPVRALSRRGVWGDDWNIKDLIIHLTQWEQMFLGWYRAGKAGDKPAMPAEGYTWRDVPELNRALQRRHQRMSVANALAAFHESYDELLACAESIPQKDLLTVGRYAWTGKSTLASYLGANSASHYRTAAKIIRKSIARGR